MNEEAIEAIQILRTKFDQGALIPLNEAEKALFPDLIDYVNAPSKSNATALLNKLRDEADRFAGQQIQDPESWDRAARQLLSMLLVPYLSLSRIYALYSAIKEHVDS